DRDARRVLLVGPAIGIVRDHRGHARRIAGAGDVQHHQQLHDMAMDRAGEGLDDVDILVANAFAELNFERSVAKALDTSRAERHAEVFTNRAGKRLVRCPGEYVRTFRGQTRPPSLSSAGCRYPTTLPLCPRRATLQSDLHARFE